MATLTLGPEAQFNALCKGDFSFDRHELFAVLREEMPIFFSKEIEAWVLTRHADVFQVLDDEEKFWTLIEGPGASMFGRSLLQWRGREHGKKSGPVVKRIRSPKAFTEGLDEKVRQITVEQADLLTFSEPIDFKSSYAMWMPLLVITDLLDIHEAQKFSDWYHAIAQGGVSSIANPGLREAAHAAREEVRALLRPIVTERAANPGTDMVSGLATATFDGEPVPFEEIVATVVFLLVAGVETTERAMTSLFRHLALDPELYDEVRARREDRTFLMSLSAEALRCYSPVQGLTRGANEPVEFHGQTVQAGDRLLVMLSSANRDPRVFDAPEEFRPERWMANAERQFLAGGTVLPFGAGRHHCAGSRLAAIEMVHGIREFCERVARIEPAGELPGPEGLLLTSPPALPMILHPV